MLGIYAPDRAFRPGDARLLCTMHNTPVDHREGNGDTKYFVRRQTVQVLSKHGDVGKHART